MTPYLITFLSLFSFPSQAKKCRGSKIQKKSCRKIKRTKRKKGIKFNLDELNYKTIVQDLNKYPVEISITHGTRMISRTSDQKGNVLENCKDIGQGHMSCKIKSFNVELESLKRGRKCGTFNVRKFISSNITVNFYKYANLKYMNKFRVKKGNFDSIWDLRTGSLGHLIGKNIEKEAKKINNCD